MRLKKNQLKNNKKTQSTWINLPNSWLVSWDWNNLIECKLKQNYEYLFPINLILKDTI